MDIERQLSEHLAEAAGHASATPDLAEVELGAQRVRGRRRVATGVVAAMLVAGAGGAGFGLGRDAAGSDGQVVAPAGSGAADDAADENADRATDDAGNVADDVGDDGQSEPANAVAEATAAPVPADLPLGAPGTRSADAKFDATAMPAYELVSERVTASGITIRALRGESWYSDEAIVPDASGWSAPRWCFGDAELRIGLSGPGLIDVTGATWYSEMQGDVAVSASQAGWADGQPMGVVAVQASDGITEVAATSGDVSDRAAPTGGAVVLLLPGIDPYTDGYTVEVTDAAGPRTLTDAELNPSNSPEWREACEPPPPALPEAGEQPADAAAAEAAVREVFATLFDTTVLREDKPDDLLDDDTGVDEAAESARSGDFGDAAASAVYTIEDFVFTSPTEAWFRYGIDTSMGHFGQRYGTASLIDGSWRIARAVICQDLAMAGAPCEPDVTPIYPPSWYEMYGDPSAEACRETEDGGSVCTSVAEAEPVPTEPAGDG
jgi:hypothetical protein